MLRASLTCTWTLRQRSPLLYAITSAQCHTIASTLKPGSKLTGESGTVYRLVDPLGSRSENKPSSVWQAIDDNDSESEFILKALGSQDDPTSGWPLFQHEHKMQTLFADSPFIRTMVDFIPRTTPSGTEPALDAEPVMVLQAFEKTLWSARLQRPFTDNEVKWIMKAVIIGLWTIHCKGLVYSDLKMENVVLNGFCNDNPGNVRSIIARLADCGAITEPSDREITSITYRSPEVYYGKAWTTSADIWSWGIVLCHLLEAQAEIGTPGLYNSISGGSLADKASAVKTAMTLDFDLLSILYYADDVRYPTSSNDE